MSEHFKISLAGECEAKNLSIFIDEFVSVDYLSKKNLETSIWISPVCPKMMRYP